MGILYIIFGILGGLLGGMGMGGGTVLIPLLTLLGNLEQHTAQAINLICFIPMSILALVINLKNKLVETKGIWTIILPACVMAVLGSFIAQWIDGDLLKKIFGGFLIIFSIVSAVLKIKKKNKT